MLVLVLLTVLVCLSSRQQRSHLQAEALRRLEARVEPLQLVDNRSAQPLRVAEQPLGYQRQQRLSCRACVNPQPANGGAPTQGGDFLRQARQRTG